MTDIDTLIVRGFLLTWSGATILAGLLFWLLLWLLKKGKKKLVEKLRNSPKFMAWLYSEEKSYSQQIYDEFCNAQVSFIRTDWRNYR